MVPRLLPQRSVPSRGCTQTAEIKGVPRLAAEGLEAELMPAKLWPAKGVLTPPL